MKTMEKKEKVYKAPSSEILDVKLPLMICGSVEGFEDTDTPSPWKP